MSGVVISVLAALIFVGIGAVEIFTNVYQDQKQSILFNDKSDSAKIAASGFGIAKAALSKDSVWNDCDESEIECYLRDELGYFPIYSNELGKTIEDLPLNKGKLTLKIKPTDGRHVKGISKGEINGKKTYFAFIFEKIDPYNKVPLAYGGSSSEVRGGRLCSYYWDGQKISGVTKPNFSVYLDSGFYWSPDILIPDDPSGPNEKDVKFATNFPTTVRGYKILDKVFSTGDVFLKEGAHVGFVMTNGKIYADETSGYDTGVENANYKFPNFNTRFTNSYFITFGFKMLWCNKSMSVPSGNYAIINVQEGCELTLDGTEYNIGDISIFGEGKIKYKNPGTKLRVNNLRNFWGDLEFVSERGRGADLTIKTNAIFLSGGFGQKPRGFHCADPITCMYDTNYLYAYGNSVLQGVSLVREKAVLSGATIIGNIFTEKITSKDSTICNIVDTEGNQVIPNSFFQIIDPKREALPPTIVAVRKVICKDEKDCDEKME